MINKELYENPDTRKALSIESFPFFVAIYFPEYISYLNAPMHNEMYNVAADEVTKLSVIVAFRGSAKSTIFSFLYPIWAILGKQKKRYVIIASNTQKLASTHFGNIKRALETNDRLRQDFGIIKGIDWNREHLIIWPNNAKIMSASLEQSVRGYRHDQFRPDLIIIDDIEDLNSVKTQEGRDKTEQWFTGDIVPSGDRNTKIVIVGNLLHEDSLLMRLKTQILAGTRSGRLLEFPIIDNDGNISWTAKYPNMEAIEQARRELANDIAWLREYELKIVNPDGMLFPPGYIQYYDALPEEIPEYTVHGVDLAISLKTHADYTAVVTAKVYGRFDNLKIYILPNPLNAKMDAATARAALENILKVMPGRMYIEDTNFQTIYVQELRAKHYPVEGVRPHGQDKWMRASAISPAVRNAVVVFPREGCELLIRQMTGFGVELHDDLLDALVYLVTKVLEKNRSRPRFWPHKPAGF